MADGRICGAPNSHNWIIMTCFCLVLGLIPVVASIPTTTVTIDVDQTSSQTTKDHLPAKPTSQSGVSSNFELNSTPRKSTSPNIDATTQRDMTPRQDNDITTAERNTSRLPTGIPETSESVSSSTQDGTTMVAPITSKEESTTQAPTPIPVTDQKTSAGPGGKTVEQSSTLASTTQKKTTGSSTTTTTQGTNTDSNKGCPTCTSESAFGTHGVLAFSITLSIAFLLMYSLLMVILVPKLLGRSSPGGAFSANVSNVETHGGYRRKYSDVNNSTELEPLRTGLTSLPPKDELETEAINGVRKDDEDSDHLTEDCTMGPNVSTFLLRHPSLTPPQGESPKKASVASTKDNTLTESHHSAEPSVAKQPPAADSANTMPAASVATFGKQAGNTSPWSAVATSAGASGETNSVDV